MKERKASVEAQELAVQLLNRDRLNPSREGGHNWVVVQIKTRHDLGDYLWIEKRNSGAACNFICKGFNFAKIFCHGHVTFLHICELYAGVDGLTLALGGEHGVDGAPYFCRRLECGNLGKNIMRERTHQIPLKLLLLCLPEGSSEVDDLFFFAVFGDGECRCQNRRILGRGSRTVRLGGW